MRKIIHISHIVFLIPAFVLLGCNALQRNSNTTLLAASEAQTDSSTRPPGTSGGNPAMVQKIFEARCTSCHSPTTTAQGGIDFITDLSKLLAQGYVISGKPGPSAVFKSACGTSKTCTSPRISDEEIAVISDWILSLK
jgi:mono/diheme cytochrome c family protein